jgi:hypothetical protein
MATVFEECITEEQRSVMRFFCGRSNSMQRIFIDKSFLFMVGSVCHVKRFKTGSRNCHLCGNRLADDEDVETEVRKWLRQQSEKTYMLRFSTHC